MRKLLPLLLLVAAGVTRMSASSPTDWLNFAAAQGDDVLHSIQFANFGKIRFGNNDSYAYLLYFDSDYHYVDSFSRYCGQSLRPVSE